VEEVAKKKGAPISPTHNATIIREVPQEKPVDFGPVRQGTQELCAPFRIKPSRMFFAIAPFKTEPSDEDCANFAFG
jgi:hypothetical protein